MEMKMQYIRACGKQLKQYWEVKAYVRNKERSWVNNISSYLKKIEKEEQTKPKTNRRKVIIEIRVEINEIGKQ